MATSPIYSWPEPDDTSLVKNGALAMRTLGNAIDTTMATMIPKSIVDAKGDLIGATANDTPARLAVGTNGQVLTADSTAATGLAWATASGGSTNVAGKNGVLNSAFNVWQRGTSISLTASNAYAYVSDRWGTSTGANQACTISRQATGDTTNLPFIQYALRYQRNSGQTGTGGLNLAQNFDTVNSIPFAGKTITMSFYARAGANYSATSSALLVYLATGTGTDQNQQTTGFSGQALPINGSTATLTTTWQRFTYSATIGATATQLCPIFSFTPTGTAGVNDYYEVTGVQIEIAGSASAYAPNASTYALELAACQRYLPAVYYGNSVAEIGNGFCISSTQGFIQIPFAVQPRVAPTGMTLSSASHFQIRQATGATQVPTGIAFNNASLIMGSILTSGNSGFVAGNGTSMQINSASGQILFTGCEL
jgi:hypothetical protein